MSVEAKIIYGFCLHDDDYKQVLTSEQVAQLCKENRNFCNRSRPSPATEPDDEFPSFMAAMKITDMFQGVETDIVAECVDFENSSQIGVDGECVLIGVCLNSGGGHYSGVLQMPKITATHKSLLNAFVSKYPQFSGFERHSYIYYRNDR